MTFNFDGESYCIVFCGSGSAVVQMTSNIADENLAMRMAHEMKLSGCHIFRVIKAGVLIAAMELIKNQEEK